MSHARPIPVALVCFFIIVNAMITTFFAILNSNPDSDLEFAKWMETHRSANALLLTLSFTHAALSMIASYLMLRGSNRGRWLYFVECALYLGTLYWALNTNSIYSASGIVRETCLFVIAVVVLSLPDARLYFHPHHHSDDEDSD